MATIEESISLSIQKNGYPTSKVRLPFRPIFDACKRENLKLSDVLKNLEDQGISSQIEEEKILFFNGSLDSDPNLESLKSGMGDLFGSAMNQMKSMDPKILDELKKKVMNMSPKERNEMLNKAKDFIK